MLTRLVLARSAVSVPVRPAFTQMRFMGGGKHDDHGHDSHTRPATKPHNPGTSEADVVSTIEKQATGDQFDELTASKRGQTRFGREPLKGAFGTMEAPVMVPSSHFSRIAGCVGGEGEAEHQLLWFELNAGRKHACPKCGQVFMLDNPNFKPFDVPDNASDQRARASESAAKQ